MAESPGTSKGDKGRLTSLKSRDLNLSGSRPKRSYTPNLNAVRNKAKPVPNLANTQSKRRNPDRNSTKKELNKSGQNERYIQSSGVFSEGTVAAVKKPSRERHAENADIAAMEMPTVDRNAAWNIDVKEENQVVNSLLDVDSDSEQLKTTYDYQPIVLPLEKNKDDFFTNYAPKLEGSMKPELNNHLISNGHAAPPTSVINSMITSPHLFNKDNLGLSLIRLPTSLPGKGFDENDQVIDYTLDKMTEGPIGRLLLRQSGTVELVIGNQVFPLETIDASTFREEVIAAPKSDGDLQNSEMTSLGDIQGKAVASPAWRTLVSRETT